MHVVIIHPDLGLGGAERLVVDFALALREEGHEVTVLCAHHDPSRCFEDTLEAANKRATWVCVRGGWLPRSILGMFHAPCAWLRCAHLALCAGSMSPRPDVALVDQVPAALPMLRRLLPECRRVFYCHFPDKLLAPRGGALRRVYRLPLDRLEEESLRSADRVLANSAYTRAIMERSFAQHRIDCARVDVLYPAVRMDPREELLGAATIRPREKRRLLKQAGVPDVDGLPEDAAIFVSINRYEEKKRLPLAVRALAAAIEGGDGAESGKKPVLIFAGGFDGRLSECHRVLEHVRAAAESLHVWSRIRLLTSVGEWGKKSLLDVSVALVYTPPEEHFGIAPLEAMARARGVIAANSGGPKESVIDGHTGWLREHDPCAFSGAMTECVARPDECARRGWNGRARAEECFSFSAFRSRAVQALSPA